MVRNSEVVLFRDLDGRVRARAVREPRSSPDTAAAEKAAAELLAVIDWTGNQDSIKERIATLLHEKAAIERKDFEKKFGRFTANPFQGDPLRMLFDLP